MLKKKQRYTTDSEKKPPEIHDDATVFMFECVIKTKIQKCYKQKNSLLVACFMLWEKLAITARHRAMLNWLFTKTKNRGGRNN